MPADAGTVEKRIREIYEIDAKQADLALTRLELRTRKLREASSKAREGLGRIGRTGIALGGAAVGGIGLVAKHLFDVGAGAETAEIGLAGLVMKAREMAGMPVSGFVNARKEAEALGDTFRKLAQTSPVQANEVREAFEVGIFPLTEAGLSFAEQAEFALATAVADLNNVVKGTAAADIRQLFAGIGNPRMIQTQILKPIAKEVADFAKSGDMRSAIALMTKQLTPPPEQLKAFEQSAGGAIATLMDRLEVLKKKAAKPLLDFVVRKVEELLKWLDRNKKKVDEMARSFGEGVVNALKKIVEFGRWIAENWRTIATIAAGFAAVTLARIVGQMGQLVVSAGQWVSALIKARRIQAATGGGGLLTGRRGKLLGTAGKVAAGAVAATEVVGLASKIAEGKAAEGVGESFGILDSIRKALGHETPQEELARLRGGGRSQAVKELLTREQRQAEELASAEESFRFLMDQAASEMTGSTKGGKPTKKKGRKRAKVAVLEVDQLKVDGRSFARMASPLVLGIQQRAAVDRPLSATVGLGGLRVPNGR